MELHNFSVKDSGSSVERTTGGIEQFVSRADTDGLIKQLGGINAGANIILEDLGHLPKLTLAGSFDGHTGSNTPEKHAVPNDEFGEWLQPGHKKFVEKMRRLEQEQKDVETEVLKIKESHSKDESSPPYGPEAYQELGFSIGERNSLKQAGPDDERDDWLHRGNGKSGDLHRMKGEDPSVDKQAAYINPAILSWSKWGFELGLGVELEDGPKGRLLPPLTLGDLANKISKEDQQQKNQPTKEKHPCGACVETR